MDFAPDTDRSIFLQGRIDQALVDRVTPDVVRLHSANPRPITVFIDSLGGFISSGGKLFDLIKAPNFNGDRADLIVIVTGTAASAAADFAALADYAYVFPHSVVLYHGTRQDSQQALTVSDAQSLAESLRQTNESYALPLAKRAVERFILRLNSFPAEFHDFLSDQQKGLDKLMAALSSRLGYPAQRLVTRALEKQHALQALSRSASEHFKRLKRKLGDNEFEGELLLSILRSKLRANKSKRWLLSEGRLDELDADFRLVHDYHFGNQASELHRLVTVYGTTFLAGHEQTNPLMNNAPDDKQRLEWIRITTWPRLQALWYFCVSLSRLLQDDDYWLSAYDAYWLGLVDEVIGSGLPNLRELLNTPAMPTSAGVSSP